jgi:hypothetical protein
MRIAVTRSGGFAGLIRRAVLDTTGRPDAFHLHALARDVLATGRAPLGDGVPDGFQYDIDVDGRLVRCFEPDLTDAQRELVSIVQKEGGTAG